MIALALISCVLLRALTAQAKVVDSFKRSENCDYFIYKGKAPSGMDLNATKICQKLGGGIPYYATLYSVHHKIPLYSAYTLDGRCSKDTERKDVWHLEPQTNLRLYDDMVRENQYTQIMYKRNQAISSDYSGTGYDRGRLNPSGFQCDEGRTATFTLTNAAPMEASFYQKHWRNWEKTLRNYLTQKFTNGGAAYIVTGTVPDPDLQIPQDSKRVTVPSHIWTAVCYKHHKDDRKSFSFGYIGRNQPKPNIRLMTVTELNQELSLHFGNHQQIQIFAEDCFSSNYKLDEVQAVFKRWVNQPVKLVVRTSPGVIYSSDLTGTTIFNSMSYYYKLAEDLKIYAGMVCPLSKVSAAAGATECLLVSEKQKTAADGSLCKSVSESDYSCRCDTGSETKSCCSTPCLYQDDLKIYLCYSDWAPMLCTPQYSLVTVNGERCLDDHPCATYGYDYYWCKTANSWDYCSPPLRSSQTANGQYCRINHACANYGYRYTWCYTDDEDSWDYC